MYLLLLSPLLFQLSGSAPITGPEAVSGLEQGSLTVQCRYDPEWETYKKWWCRGADWSRCKILVQTTGSEEEVKKDRVSIRDNQRSHMFTVTMEKLRRDDADTYWCGIERTGPDHGVKIKVTVGPGSAPITGPEAVSGLEQGSLTVQCRYDPEWETYKKWWCRGADWSRCKILVQTTGSEEEVKKDRVSIRDNQRSHMFTVTMEKLRRDDADTYWCGIERTGPDHGVKIKVTVGPATTTAPNTTPTTCTATSVTNMFTASVTPGDTTGYRTVTSHHSDGSGDSMKLSVLLPLIFAVLLLLFMAASLLAWRMVKQQKKAAGKSPEQVVQPLESDLCYANLTLQQNGTFPSSSRKKASTKFSPSAQEDQVEVEYITMAPFPKEDISYAALSLGTSDQEPTYSNTGGLITHLPSGSHEEPMEYSTIRKT